MSMRDDVLSALDTTWRKARDVLPGPISALRSPSETTCARWPPGQIEEKRAPIPSGVVAMYRLKTL